MKYESLNFTDPAKEKGGAPPAAPVQMQKQLQESDEFVRVQAVSPQPSCIVNPRSRRQRMGGAIALCPS